MDQFGFMEFIAEMMCAAAKEDPQHQLLFGPQLLPSQKLFQNKQTTGQIGAANHFFQTLLGSPPSFIDKTKRLPFQVAEFEPLAFEDFETFLRVSPKATQDHPCVNLFWALGCHLTSLVIFCFGLE
jgi:hypothetical protein